MDSTGPKEAHETRQARRAAQRQRQGQTPSKTEQARRRGRVEDVPRAQRRAVKRAEKRATEKRLRVEYMTLRRRRAELIIAEITREVSVPSIFGSLLDPGEALGAEEEEEP